MRIRLYIKNALKLKIFLLTSIIITAISVFIPNFYSWAKASPEIESVKCVKLPVLMYHLVSENQNIKNKFIISKKTFEDDLKYIKDNGYTTVLVSDLIEYTEGKKDLPPKPIMLTFDDGAFNNYLYAFPLAKKYGAKFIFSPIAKEADRYTKVKDETPSYAHANWSRIDEMAKTNLVEIQNHTYNMHSGHYPRIGCTKKSGETLDVYKENLTEDLNKAQTEIEETTGKRPTAFFYPFGAKSKCSEEIIKSLGFKATFICESRVNTITKDPNCLFNLGRFLRPPEIPAKIFFKKLEK